MAKHKVVIAGGGFGGVKLALELANDSRFDITLISNHDDFWVYPTLYHVSTGGPKRVSSIPLSEVFAGKPVTLVVDEAISIDRKQRALRTSKHGSFQYEAAVFGLGVQTNYFGISGLKEYSYGIKSPQDAQDLKTHLHNQLLQDKQPDLNYVVVGGGPTGIELAGALPAYIQRLTKQHGLPKRKIHVDLVEAAPRIAPRMPRDISRFIARNLRKQGVKIYTKTVVQAQTADALMVNNKPIRSHTVIWTAGVMNNPFFAANEFQLARNSKVRVDQFLQSEPGVYVLGDNADTPYSGMAQTALYDALFIAANLQRIASKQDPRPYVAKKPIYVFPAGPKWAAVLWGPVRIYGRLGWLLRSLADLVQYHDYLPWKLAVKRWTLLDDREESCAVCANRIKV